MNVFCKGIGRELEMETFLKEAGPAPAIVVKHSSLEDIYYNELQVTLPVTCEMKAIKVSPDHNVFECTISDGGRTTKAIGESSPNTLDSQIAKDYPATIAYQRAFDRSLIRYLGLPGRVLSDLEITKEEIASLKSNDTSVTEKEVAKEAEVVSPVSQPPEEDMTVKQETVNEKESQSSSHREEPRSDLAGTPYEGMDETEEIPAPAADLPTFEELENTVLTFGKNKGTAFKDVQGNYLEWLVGNSNRPIVAKVKMYLEMKASKKEEKAR